MLKRHHRIVGAASSVAIAMMVATACNGDSSALDDLSGEEIYDRGLKALLDAESMRLAGSLDGYHLDLFADRADNCIGELSADGEGSVEYAKSGDDLWVKPDDQFWSAIAGTEQGDAAQALVGDRYIHDPTGGALFDDIFECDIGDVVGELMDDGIPEDADVTKGDVTTQDGVEVLELVIVEDGEEITVFVEASGEFYPRRVVRTDGEVAFSDFNEEVVIEEPGEDEVVDVSRVLEVLGGGN